MPENQEQRGQSLNINEAKVGLDLDSIITQITPGKLTYALNAQIEGFDGNAVSYQNEAENVLCVQLPVGYKVVGVKNVTSIDTVYYFITNPDTGYSQIGYSLLNSCAYNILLDDSIANSDLLNFKINAPIHDIEVKTTNCSTQLYWTDNLNPRRYIDLTNLPWKTTIIAGVIIPIPGQINANDLNVQPNFNVPQITLETVNIGGNLIEGTYQFAIQYADALSNAYSSFYSVTNEVRIFLDHKVSENFNEQTNKSISINISNLDDSGLYSYFNLAVIKTINAIVSVDLVGTYYINGTSKLLTYTGEEQSQTNVKLTIEDIFQKNDYYNTAAIVTQVDNHLVWADLTKEDDISYQSIWSQIPVIWETYKIPYNQSEGYYNGINCANLQGFMRDEVYALEGCFVLANGKETTRCHIPGRALIHGWDDTQVSNFDAQAATSIDSCNTNNSSEPNWKVYNTAKFGGSYTNTDCIGPYQWGQMGYFESTRLYPNNIDIWGALANQPIRHHRFPDSSVTHIHDQNPNAIGTDAYNQYEHEIYPIGFNIDVNILWNAINNSNLTDNQKKEIVGFKLMRGDRTNNKSIIAKGMFYNCGMYTKQGSNYYYPNYPFNDLNPDQFISSQPVENQSGNNSSNLLDNFQNSRFTFHSPDTAFYKPSGIQGSLIKFETVEYGNCKGHFVPVKLNAGQKLRTGNDLLIAATAAVASSIGLQGSVDTTVGTVTDVTIGVAPAFHPENFFPTFNDTLDLLDKLSPYVNYGWQYNAVGYYGNYQVTPQTGYKIRQVTYGGYITSGLESTFGDNYPINNTFRESSIYVSTAIPLQFTNVNTSAPADNSRVIASQAGVCNSSSVFYRNVASYYGSIKQYLPDQWGDIFSYNIVDTGIYATFFDQNGNLQTSIPTIFGGDIFINRFAFKRKHSFFLKDTVESRDGSDVDYNQDLLSQTNTGNVGYPIWYYSTTNLPLNVNGGLLHAGIVNLTNALNNWMLAIATLGLTIALSGLQVIVGLVFDLLTEYGIKITNLDCEDTSGLHLKGQAYQYAYGVPYYFVESEVNVDMRQATNETYGNFYPQVASDIPDQWLQESNTKIAYDNSYVYNKTYSKQNKETFYPILRPDWTPNNPCYTNFNNRVIWSDKSSVEDIKNNWLIYKPGSTYDLPKSYGLLKGVDSLKNNEVLVRFADKSQKYNAQTNIQITQGPSAYLGNTQMFSAPPIDLVHSDTGRAGSQNQLILKTDFGNVFVDAKRGAVLMLGQQQSYFDNGVQDLSIHGMGNWFKKNLPFQILNYFSNINTDNVYNGIGITGVYDAYYSRIILTKRDYVPLSNDIEYDGTNFYINQSVPGIYACCPTGYTLETSIGMCVNLETKDEIPVQECSSNVTEKIIIQLTDPKYFCNKSWSLSYSFKTQSWISWHSYIPNYYIQFYNYFQSGRNDLFQTWSHSFENVTNFNKFYGEQSSYILEYPFAYKLQDEILQNVKDFTTVRQYLDYLTFFEPDTTIYFDKSIIYNSQQCTGILQLIPRPLNNLSAYQVYPIYNYDSKSILVTKSDNYYNYNTFWDITINKSQPIWILGCDLNVTDKDLNQSNMNYVNSSYKKAQIRAKDCKIRHILDDKNQYRFISKFILSPSVPSFK